MISAVTLNISQKLYCHIFIRIWSSLVVAVFNRGKINYILSFDDKVSTYLQFIVYITVLHTQQVKFTGYWLQQIGFTRHENL